MVKYHRHYDKSMFNMTVTVRAWEAAVPPGPDPDPTLGQKRERFPDRNPHS